MKTYCSQKKKVVITGGAGFIGHHVVEHLLRKTNWDIYIVDKLSYASFGPQIQKKVLMYIKSWMSI